MNKETKKKMLNFFQKFIFRTLLAIILFLLLGIIAKSNKEYKDIIVKNLYEKNIEFPKIKNLYNKYLGGVVPLEKIVSNEKQVFKEELKYNDKSIYHEGVKLEVENNYLVPIQKEGMVIYIGKKENYGKVVIIEGIDGIDIWYGNMSKISPKLYDYVEQGTYLGETENNYLYLAYQKEGKFMDYNNFIS